MSVYIPGGSVDFPPPQEVVKTSHGFFFQSDEEPFVGYRVTTNETGPGFYAFVVVYAFVALALIAPLVKWSKQQEEKKLQEHIIEEKASDEDGNITNNNKIINKTQHEVSPNDLPTPVASNNGISLYREKLAIKGVVNKSKSLASRNEHYKKYNSRIKSEMDHSVVSRKSQLSSPTKRQSSVITTGSRSTSALRSVILRELDQSYPDQDPDFQMACFRISPSGSVVRQIQQQQPQPQTTKKDGSKAPTEETSSGVPSAATTSKVFWKKRNPSIKQKFTKQVLNVGGRRWKSRRPIGRVDVIQNVVASELSSLASGNEIGSTFLAVTNDPTNTFQEAPDHASCGHKSNRNKNLRNSSCTTSNHNRTGRPVNVGLPHQLAAHHSRQRGMSDVASSILSEQHHQLKDQPEVQVDITILKRHQQLEQYHMQQLHLQQQLQHHQQQQQQPQLHPFVLHRLAALQRQQRYFYSTGRRSSRSGRSEVSERSAMSSIVDDISPDDAADANDPGKGNIFIEPDAKHLQSVMQQQQQQQQHSYVNSGYGIHAGCCTAPIEGILSLAGPPHQDKRRVLINSVPLTIGACSEALFRLITTAFISQYLGTESMIAFLLVGLFVRLTSEELADAIIDALSSFVHASICTPSSPPPQSGGEVDSTHHTHSSFLAGQYIQLAFMLQLVLNIPLLIGWVVCMEKVVLWFVDSPTVAAIAKDYAFVVVFAYLVQSLSRTLTVVFHICGHEHFESITDMVASTLQSISIACVVALVDDASLTTVGYVQVLITTSAAIAKILFPVVRGWMQPFRKGLVQNVALFSNQASIWHLLKAAAPLLLGTILEFGEWELLTIFVRHLGPAEVATWALLGAFWDFLEALTEGIGEGAANQVAFLLSIGLVERAKKLSYGVIYMAVVQAIIITSVLYMLGQYLAVLFTKDPTIQHLMNNTIVMIGVSNIVMSFAQITWSLVGAQGRFRLATLAIFSSRWLVSMPCALISIYVSQLDLNAVSGSLVVGYITATSALMFVVLRSDWERLSDVMQDMNQPPVLDDPKSRDYDESNGAGGVENGLGFVDLDDFDDSDDSDSDRF